MDVDDLDSSDDDESNARKTLEQCLGKLSLDPGKPHFFGKSSRFMLFQTAMDAKDEYANIKSSFSSQRQGEAFKLPFEGSNFLSSRSVSVVHPHVLAGQCLSHCGLAVTT